MIDFDFGVDDDFDDKNKMRLKSKRIFTLTVLLILFYIIYKFHSHTNKEQNQIRKRIKFLVKELGLGLGLSNGLGLVNSDNQLNSEKKLNNGIVMISNSKSLETTLKIIKFYENLLFKNNINSNELEKNHSNHHSNHHSNNHSNHHGDNHSNHHGDRQNVEIFFIEREMNDNQNDELNLFFKEIEDLNLNSRSFHIELKLLNFENDYLKHHLLLFSQDKNFDRNCLSNTFDNNCASNVQEMNYYTMLINQLVHHYKNHNDTSNTNDNNSTCSACQYSVVSLEKPFYFKQLAILQSSFENVLFLDNDNILLQNPSFLFQSKQFLHSGLVLWNDFFIKKTPLESPLYKITDTGYRLEYERESGQLLINKSKHSRTLELALYLTLDPDLQKNRILLYGDKDTFELAARLLQLSFTIIPYNVLSAGEWNQEKGHVCGYALMQRWFDGSPLFIHAVFKKIHSCSRLDSYSVPHFHALGITWDDWCIRFKSGSIDKRLDETWPHIFTKEYLELTSACLYF